MALAYHRRANVLSENWSKILIWVREWLGDWGGKLTAAFGAFLVFHVIYVFFPVADPEDQSLTSNLITLIIYVGPCIAAWRASTHSMLLRRSRRAWRLIAFANLSFIVGTLLWIYFENYLGEQPFPSWADAGYLAFYPLMFVGLLSMVEKFESGEERLNFWLDSGIVLIGGSMVVWYFLIRPMTGSNDGDTLKTFLTIAYPAGDLVLLLGISSLLLRRAGSTSKLSVNFLLVGTVFNFAADFAFSYQSLHGTYVTGAPIDALFTLACFPIMVAAQAQWVLASRSEPTWTPDSDSTSRNLWLPYLAVAVAYLVMFAVAYESSDIRLDAIMGVAGLVTALVIVRQFMFVRANTKANLALSELQDRIQGIFSASTDAIGLATFEGTLTEVNDSFVRLTGYPRQEIVGAMRYQDFVSEDHLDKTSTPDLAIKGGRSLEYERDLVRPDGTSRSVTTTLYGVDDSKGNPVAVAIVIRDVTERKLEMAQLKEAYAQLDHVFANSPGIIYRNRIDGPVITPLAVSPNIEAILGYGPDEVLSAGWWMESLHPDDIEKAVNEIAEILERGRLNTEYRIRHKDGRYRWVDDSRTVIHDADRSNIEMIGFMADITEKKAAETDLAETREQYNDLFENATDLIQAVRPDGSIAYVNKAWREALGYREDEIAKISMFDIIAKDEHEHCLKEMKTVMTGKAVATIETEFVSKGGRKISVEGNITCKFVDGKPAHTRGIFHDITERKAAERKLREINDGMRLQTAALESTANGVAITNTKGIIEWINPAFTQLTGYSAEEAIGQNPRILNSGKNSKEFYDVLWGTITKGDFWQGDLINRRKDGTFYYEQMTITPVRDADGNIGHFVAIKQDVTASRLAEESLRINQAKLAKAQEIAHMGYWEWNMITDEIFWSDEAFRILGLDPAHDQASAATFLERVHPDDRERVKINSSNAIEKNKWENIEYRVIRPDGSHAYVLSEGVFSGDDETGSYRITGIMLDITARRESENRFRSIVESAYDAIILLDHYGKIVSWNEAARTIFGYEVEEVIGGSLPMLFPDTYDEDISALADCKAFDLAGLTLPGCRATELTGMRKNGENFPLEITVSSWEAENGNFYSAIVRDITQRKTLEDQLTYQTLHDPLTKLANRVLFQDRLAHAIKKIKRSGATVGVLFIDLDNFKNVNDTLGHNAGDELLIAVADRMKSCLRDGDTAARFGGDEFAVLIEDPTGVEGAMLVAERIRDAVTAPFYLGSNEAHVGTSIGIAVTGPGNETPELLLQNADVAMYIAKTSGKNRYVVFEPHMQEAIVKRVQLETDMRAALQRNEFEVYYQPIVNLNSERVEGMEALVRWNHPTSGLMMPCDFIRIAEETHLIIQLGKWVMEEACIQARIWQKSVAGGERMTLTVNIATQQFQDDGLLAAVRKALDVSGLPPSSLVLEVTETTMLLDTDKTLKTIDKLRSLGVRLAIDDFGTGYSSLSYLQRFAIDVLKIDKSFIDSIVLGDETSAVARAIISMGQSLRMKTIAEGIESAAQQAELYGLGCEYGQGYFFAKPLAKREMDEYLRTHSAAGALIPPVAIPIPDVFDAENVAAE